MTTAPRRGGSSTTQGMRRRSPAMPTPHRGARPFAVSIRTAISPASADVVATVAVEMKVWSVPSLSMTLAPASRAMMTPTAVSQGLFESVCWRRYGPAAGGSRWPRSQSSARPRCPLVPVFRDHGHRPCAPTRTPSHGSPRPPGGPGTAVLGQRLEEPCLQVSRSMIPQLPEDQGVAGITEPA